MRAVSSLHVPRVVQHPGVKYQSTASWVREAQCPVEATWANQAARLERALWLSNSCPRASIGTPCKYSALVYCHLETSAEEKGKDNRGKAVVWKLSTVCEQCSQVSHESSNKGGRGGGVILQSWMVSFNLQTCALCDSFFNPARVYKRLTLKNQ